MLQYLGSAGFRVEIYDRGGGIEGVPNLEPGNYSGSTEHTKYSQSVLSVARAVFIDTKRMWWS